MAEPEAAQSSWSTPEPPVAAGSQCGASTQSTLSTESTLSTLSGPLSPLPITNPWRGLLTLSLGATLCVLAIAESAGEASAPAWFLGFAIPVLTEWIGEWLAYWRKRGEV